MLIAHVGSQPMLIVTYYKSSTDHDPKGALNYIGLYSEQLESLDLKAIHAQ